MSMIRDDVETVREALVASRRWLHQHAELSHQEYETADYLETNLRTYPGIEVTRPTRTSILGILRTGRPGPVIALRADIDALPIHEENDLPYRSCHEGVMHACGHDGHAAILLYTARLAAMRRELLCGEIRFIFQHAEELPPGGGQELIQLGVMDGVQEVYGIHLSSGFPTGCFATRPGPLTSSVDKFHITVRGKGGHSSMPERCIDPVVTAAEIITALQTIVSRSINPIEPAAISVCQVRAGTAYNIIPETVSLIGSTRTYTKEVRAMVEERVKSIASHIAQANGASAEVEYEHGYGSIYNHPAIEAKVEQIISSEFGREALMVVDPLMPSDDFSVFTDAAPGCSVQVGMANPGKGSDAPHHNARFMMDEDALALGVMYMTAVVRDRAGMQGKKGNNCE